jgi:hypothetical protein
MFNLALPLALIPLRHADADLRAARHDEAARPAFNLLTFE